MRKAARKLPPLPVRAARMLARLKNLQGLSEGEKSVHALGLAATPQERWDLFEQSARSSGFWTPSKRKNEPGGTAPAKEQPSSPDSST